MRKHQQEFSIRKMARTFEVSVSGYYAWQARKPSRHSQSDSALVEQIRRIQKRHEGRYGSPRMHEDLRDAHIKISRKQVARLMRLHGLSARNKRKWVTTTDSRHKLPVSENILNREFVAATSGTKWVSDITYLRTSQGWLYLCVIIDLWDRKVVGWSLATDMAAIHVIRALAMACLNRKPKPGLVFHSDRGVQYCSKEFRQALGKECPTVRQSMSWKGNCWDNACAESFFKTLKRELAGLDGQSTRKQVKLSVFEYIEAYYNRIRKHSALGYVTPVSFNRTVA